MRLSLAALAMCAACTHEVNVRVDAPHTRVIVDGVDLGDVPAAGARVGVHPGMDPVRYVVEDGAASTVGSLARTEPVWWLLALGVGGAVLCAPVLATAGFCAANPALLGAPLVFLVSGDITTITATCAAPSWFTLPLCASCGAVGLAPLGVAFAAETLPDEVVIYTRAALLMRPLAFTVVALAACAPSGPVTVEALVADPAADDGVRLDDVTLDTLVDIADGSGALFSARGGLQMAGLTVSRSAQDGDSFEVMRKKTRGDGGKPMRPNMTFDGTRFIAEDMVTLTYFTVFDALESAWLYARDEMGDASPATSEESLIGIESSVVAADLLPIPILTSDNAAYAAPLDAWLTLRVGVQEGVPFGMSYPVIAHELHHRVFHRNVFDDDAAFAIWRARVLDPTEEERRATRILQGVDEGLADLFSIAATRDPDGLRRSFAQAQGDFAIEAARRDLGGAFADNATYDNLRTNTLDAEYLQQCRSTGTGDLFNEGSFNFYCLGTVLARALWDGSDHDLEVLRGEVMPAVNRSLPRVGDVLVEGRSFDVDVLLAPLVDNLPDQRRAAVCDRLRERFESLVDDGKVPGCS